MKIIFESSRSLLELDEDKQIVYKTLKGDKDRTLSPGWFTSYRTIAKIATTHVRVLNQVDDYTFAMKYIPNILDNLENVLKNPNGLVFKIAHQYNRIPEWNEKIISQYV